MSPTVRLRLLGKVNDVSYHASAVARVSIEEVFSAAGAEVFR